MQASKPGAKSRGKVKKRSSNGDQVTVFDRLYQLAKERAESEQEHQSTSIQPRPKEVCYPCRDTHKHLHGGTGIFRAEDPCHADLFVSAAFKG